MADALTSIQNELATIRLMVSETNERVGRISTQQDELIQSVDILTASVDKLNTTLASAKTQCLASKHSEEAEIRELRQKITDVATTMGTAVVNVHRDFAMILGRVGPAFEQVERTVAPFATAVSGLIGDAPMTGHPPVQVGDAAVWHGASQQQQQQH